MTLISSTVQRRGPSIFTSFQATRDNFFPICDMVGTYNAGYVNIYGPIFKFYYKQNGSNREFEAPEGHWVVSHGNGVFEVLTPRQYAEIYDTLDIVEAPVRHALRA